MECSITNALDVSIVAKSVWYFSLVIFVRVTAYVSTHLDISWRRRSTIADLIN